MGREMQKLRTFLHIIDVTNEWVGKIVSFLIILLIGTMVWLILARYAFQVSSIWYAAPNKFLFIYVIFGAAYTLLIRGHVNMDILYNRLRPRVRGIVDVITSIFFFLFCVALLWMAVEEAVDDASRLHLSFKLFLPQNWPTALLAPFGAFLFLLQGLAKFLRDLIIAITGEESA